MISKIQKADLKKPNKVIYKYGVLLIVILVIIITFITCSNTHFLLNSYNSTPVPEWLKDMPIAHRGLFTEAYPENTLGAFKNAIQSTYAIELDVLDAQDNLPIVYHDESLLRLTGYNKSIHDLSLGDLSQYRILNTEYCIPTFKETLDLVDGKVPLVIDIKQNKYNVNFLTNVKDCLQTYNGSVVIQSFNPLVLRWFSEEMPNILRVQALEDLNGMIQQRRVITFKDNLLTLISRPNLISCKRNLLEDGVYNDLFSEGVFIIGWVYSIDEWDHKAYMKLCNNAIVGGPAD